MELRPIRTAPDHRAAVGADPQSAAGVQLHIRDERIRQTTEVAGLAQVLERVAVEAVEAILRAEPHESLCVLRDRHHCLLGQPIVEPEALEAHRDGGKSFPAAAADQGQQQHQQCAGARPRRRHVFPALQRKHPDCLC
jgi:hypothetical protein